jgi:hypothetical protein
METVRALIGMFTGLPVIIRATFVDSDTAIDVTRRAGLFRNVIDIADIVPDVLLATSDDPRLNIRCVASRRTFDVVVRESRVALDPKLV